MSVHDLERASARICDRKFQRHRGSGEVLASAIAYEHMRNVLVRYAAILKAQRDKAHEMRIEEREATLRLIRGYEERSFTRHTAATLRFILEHIEMGRHHYKEANDG